MQLCRYDRYRQGIVWACGGAHFRDQIIDALSAVFQLVDISA